MNAVEGEYELLALDKRIHLTTEQGAPRTIPCELDAASARQKIKRRSRQASRGQRAWPSSDQKLRPMLIIAVSMSSDSKVV